MEGSGRVWEGFWEGLGTILTDFSAFLQVWGRFGTSLKIFNLAGKFSKDFLCEDPRVVSRSPAERPNARGSSTPRVLDYFLLGLSQASFVGGAKPFLRRLRGDRRHFLFPSLLGHFSHFFAFFRNFFAFFRLLKPSWHFLSIFFGFSSILGGF